MVQPATPDIFHPDVACQLQEVQLMLTNPRDVFWGQ